MIYHGFTFFHLIFHEILPALCCKRLCHPDRCRYLSLISASHCKNYISSWHPLSQEEACSPQACLGKLKKQLELSLHAYMNAKSKKKSSLHDTGSLALAHWTLTPPSYSETSRREAQTEPYQHDILPDQAGQIKLQSPNTTLVAAMKTE